MAVQRDKIIASAEKLVAKGKIEPAIKEYERLLEDNPGDVNTLNRIGDLWVRINRNDEAVKVFGRIADHYARDGFFLKAIAIFKKINKLDPSKLDVYAKLADLYAKQGLAMEAKSQYQVLADYYIKHGDPGNALATYRKIAELDPNSINVHVKLADLYSQNNQVAEALKEYDRVGKMLIKRSMLEEATQVYKKALKIDPKNAELTESLVNSLLEAKDYSNAAQILDTAMATNPGNPKLVALEAKLKLAKGDVGAARKTLEEGISANANDPAVRDSLAEIHLKEGAPDKALEILRPMIEGAISRGDRAALEMLQRILRTDASHVPSLEQLVRAYTALNEETNILSSLNSLAEAHISKRNYDRAEVVLEDLIRREPENAQHRDKLAFVQQKTGRYVESAPPPPSAPKAAPAPPQSDFAIDFDDSPGLELDLAGDPAPPAPEPQRMAAAATPPPVPSMDAEVDDIDYITEHMTEAEVFAKYGLAEKAIEHLRNVIDRSPSHAPAHERLLRLYLDEGMNDHVQSAADAYISVLREKGDFAAIDLVSSELVDKGFGSAASATHAPPASRVIEEQVPRDVEQMPVMADDFSVDLESDVMETEMDLEFDGGEIPVAEAPRPEPVAEEIVEPLPEETISFSDQFDSSMLEDDLSAPLPSFDDDLPALDEPVLEMPSIDMPSIDMPSIDTSSIEMSPIEMSEAESDDLEAPLPLSEEVAMPESPLATPAAEEIGEIDFYVEQELFDEAQQKLDALLARFPDHPELLSRAERIAASRQDRASMASASSTVESDLLGILPDDDDEFLAPAPEIPAAPAPPPPPPAVSAAAEQSLFADEDDFFDLAAELEEELQEEADELVSLKDEEQSLEEIFKEFKKGVEQQLDSEDYDTHYNLGIAYKEMGLIDEAIGEFQLASKDPKRVIECCSMLGLCFLEKGMPQLSIKWYRKGLEVPEIKEDEHLGLMYDLGSAYVETGDTESAHKAFVEIYGIRSNYRDIANRIKQLENA
jgi:pilus assembly protein FimV